MAIVFWKPCAQNDTREAMKQIFSDIDEQDSQVGKLPIKPFFPLSASAEENTLFISDLPNTVPDPLRFLQELKATIQHFSARLNSGTGKTFLSIRNRQWLPLIESVMPEAENNLSASFQMIKAEPPSPIKASFSSTIPLSMSARNPMAGSPQFGSQTSSLHNGKIWWPIVFSEAQRIIPIHLFSHSHLFTIHSCISSFFYSMPSSSQSYTIIHSDPKKRAQVLGEFMAPLISKISHSALIGWHKEASFVLVSNDLPAGDSFASALGGLRALQIPLIKYAHQRRWGTGDIVKINLLGPKFLKPLFNLTLVPRLHQKHCMQIDPASCTHCEACLSACPKSAWNNRPNTYEWIPSACNQCGHCIDLCPVNAIKIIL